ncbi:hypothetical protein UFOVP141_20 [uncultured Caudovirales phage]|uniref:Uncharacterized protein n=1 Tax=uncultured Caudovirales phage TaxID=2100421 RepID=A0A6J7VM79_9CAUD|nr:hypothetical protein UFOVP141_20 [uncultured Caudovirales phage]
MITLLIITGSLLVGLFTFLWLCAWFTSDRDIEDVFGGAVCFIMLMLVLGCGIELYLHRHEPLAPVSVEART